METKELKFNGMLMNGFLMLFVNLLLYVVTMAVATYGIVLLADENGQEVLGGVLLCVGGGDAAVLHPLQGAARGVDFDREGDEGEKGGDGKEDDGDKHQAGDGLDEEESGEEYQGDPSVGKADNGHQG